MPASAPDIRHMRRCLELAARARGRTSPNPLVGCVVVGAGGRVLAEGWHKKAGEPHAEIVALGKLGMRAPGATLYVNLEPCAHVGRTGPCSPVVAASGVRRVVVGTTDPFPKVDGRGLRLLRRAGIAVTVGVLEEECRALNDAFFTYVRLGRPFVTLKAAASLDGRIATRTGDSRWVTGPEARLVAHELRDEHDAVLVGARTALRDNPLLTTRLPPRHRPAPWRPRDPVRVVLDGALRLPPTAKMLRVGSPAPTLVLTSEAASSAREKALARAGAEVLRVPPPPARGRRRASPDPHRVDLKAALALLARRDIVSLLVEGGGTVHGALIAARLWDRLALFLAPALIGADGVPLAAMPSPARMADALRLRLSSLRRVGDDILLLAARESSKRS